MATLLPTNGATEDAGGPASSSAPTTFQRFKSGYGEYVAEAIGAGTIILFGAGASAQAQLYAGSPLSSHLGWALGVAIGAYVAGPISGGHLNPAVTFAQALFRRFPLAKVPAYIAAQTVGCFVATWIVYTNYAEAIDHYEAKGGAGSGHRSVFGPHATAANFISVPTATISAWANWHNEFLGTAVLVGAIFALTSPTLPGHAPFALALFGVFFAITNALGAQTGAAVNPARDLGPRIALATFGYPAKDLFTHNAFYWIHSIWVADVLGALVGAGLVDLFLYTGTDSIFNRGIELQ